MRPTFMGFESVSRGLMANQKALDIIGNNLGNIGVTGYTRQRVDLASIGTNSRYARFSQKTSTLAGQGVNVVGVSQIRDPFLDKRFRTESADVGYFGKMNDVLTDLESAINDINPSPMGTAIEQFQQAFQAMQGGKLDAVASNTILAAATNIAQAFKQMDSKLSNVWEQQRFDLSVNVSDLNSTLASIAQLNGTIKKEVFNSSKPGNEYFGPNELLDQRNVLLDRLAEFGDINVKTNADGTVTVKMGEQTVIEDESYDTANLVTNKFNNTVAVNWQTTGKPIQNYSGSLKAAVEMINGRGSNASPTLGESFEKGILYYKDKINTFATVVADTFNNSIKEYEPAQLPDGTPNPDAGVFRGYKTLFVFTDVGDRTAGGITINKVWQNDPEFIIKDVHKPGDITDGTEGDNSKDFLTPLLENFTKDLKFGEFTGTMNDYVKFYSVAGLGNQKKAAEDRLEASADIAGSLLDRIASISGVSQEEDGVDMMQYTKAYNSMARLMTTLDEAMDVLINRTGLVGR